MMSDGSGKAWPTRGFSFLSAIFCLFTDLFREELKTQTLGDQRKKPTLHRQRSLKSQRRMNYENRHQQNP
nr:MAG TPA: hypothetical protein [Caudoviricetes sp.]